MTKITNSPWTFTDDLIMQSTCRLYFFLATAAAAAANTKAPEPPGAHLLGRLDGDNRHDATSSTSTSTSTSTHYTVVVQYSASTGIETSTVTVVV
jgi:hypothetical protein